MTNAVQTETIVTLTEKAAAQIKQMQADQAENQGKPLRIYVEEGGCSGLQYGMTFDERRDGDIQTEFFGIGVVVDSTSADFVKGAVVDFSEEMTGGGFKISNPKAKTSCGCGRSFET